MTRLTVQRFGSAHGRAILALHGVTGHGGRWWDAAARLDRGLDGGARVIAPDLRGHGHSPWEPPWHVEQHVHDLVQLLDDENLGAVDVLAHSFGCMIALHLARAHPERVRTLALLDPALGLDPADMLETAQEARDQPRFANPREAHEDKREGWSPRDEAMVAREVADHLQQDADGWWRWRVCQAAVVASWGEMARPAVLPPHLPTLVVPAAEGGYLDTAWLAQVGHHLADALTVETLDCGHMVYVEQPIEVADLVRQHLAAH